MALGSSARSGANFNSRPRMRANKQFITCTGFQPTFQLPPSHEGEPNTPPAPMRPPNFNSRPRMRANLLS